MQNKNVIRYAFTVGGFTMLSRVLGMVRDMLTAAVFGTSLAMSAFIVAFRIPNLFRALFGEGALSSAFVPVFMKARRTHGEAAAWLLARRVMTLVGIVLLAIVLIGMVGITLVLWLPGLNEKAASVLPLARIMLPYVFFICMDSVHRASRQGRPQSADICAGLDGVCGWDRAAGLSDARPVPCRLASRHRY